MSRRALLATGGISIASVAGCSALSPESPGLELILYNHADSAYTVEISLFRVDGDLSRSDARSYSGSINVGPEGEARRTDVAEVRQYLVQYEVYENNSRQTDSDHIHYYPADSGEADGLTFDIRPPGVMIQRK